MALLREKTEIQSQLEENEEDMAELLKKYKAAVQQQSVSQITLNDQLQQIEELIRERDLLKQQVSKTRHRKANRLDPKPLIQLLPLCLHFVTKNMKFDIN